MAEQPLAAQQATTASGSMQAVVVGATGAIGRELVGQLLQSPRWATVTTVGRRAVEVPAKYPQSEWRAKLEQVVIDMDRVASEGAPAFQGAHTVFCTLGTTRKAAGSADAYIKVDLHYVEESAKAAKAAGAQHFSLVTAVGANANIWANKLAPFHPLLYTKVKGQAEEAVKAQGFPWVSIMRPGMLARGPDADKRWVEAVFSKVTPASLSIPVADVARVMVLDAERPGGGSGVHVYEMKQLQKAAKQGAAP